MIGEKPMLVKLGECQPCPFGGSHIDNGITGPIKALCFWKLVYTKTKKKILKRGDINPLMNPKSRF